MVHEIELNKQWTDFVLFHRQYLNQHHVPIFHEYDEKIRLELSQTNLIS